MTLDLRNNTITVGELLDNRASRSVFQRRFGKFMNHPLVGASRSLTLAQLVRLAPIGRTPPPARSPPLPALRRRIRPAAAAGPAPPSLQLFFFSSSVPLSLSI